jgi:transcriptional regulator with XRE-family HTH domain
VLSKERFLRKLGLRIVQLRKSKGLSQTDLAHACGKDPQSIDRVEKRKINPSAYYLSELALALNTPVSEFFNFE